MKRLELLEVGRGLRGGGRLGGAERDGHFGSVQGGCKGEEEEEEEEDR